MADYMNVTIIDIDEQNDGGHYRHQFELPSPDGVTTTVFRATDLDAAHGVIDNRLADLAHAVVVVEEPVAEKPAPEPVAEKPAPELPLPPKPEPVAEKPAPELPLPPKPEPVAEKPEPELPLPPKPEPVAEKPAPEPEKKAPTFGRKPAPGKKPRR
jgi:hypothetical protein